MTSHKARQIMDEVMAAGDNGKTLVERIYENGVATGRAKTVLWVLDARHLAPTTEQRQLITSCRDLTQLDLWFDRAATVATTAEVFAD